MSSERGKAMFTEAKRTLWGDIFSCEDRDESRSAVVLGKANWTADGERLEASEMSRAHEVLQASCAVMVLTVAESLPGCVYRRTTGFLYVIRRAASVPVTMVIPRWLKGSSLKYLCSMSVYSFERVYWGDTHPQIHTYTCMHTQAKSNYWRFVG